MKTEQTANELVIRETPGCLWLLGLLFVFVGGVFVYGSLGGFTNADEVPRYAVYLSFLMGAIGAGAGFWVIFRVPVTNVSVNRLAKTVVHTRRGLFGINEETYSFDRIKQFCLIEEKDSEGDPIWSLGIKPADGETIKISSLESHSETYRRDFVFQIDQFMNKQMPSYNSSFEPEDETVGKIS